MSQFLAKTPRFTPLRRSDQTLVSEEMHSSLSVVAIKAVAHKLARACWHVMKDGKPFDVARAFG